MSATITARIGTTDWQLTGVRTTAGTTCDHCGRTLKNLYDITHTQTGARMTVGRGCCKKVTGWTLATAQARQLLRAAEEKARQEATWTEFSQAYPEAAQMLEHDIKTWRPSRPGQYNIPLDVKRNIVRGATPRSFWPQRVEEYRRKHHA